MVLGRSLASVLKFVIKEFGDVMDDSGREPIYFHSLHVMMQMKTESERIVGALHDIPETFGYSPHEIATLFLLSAKEEEALELLTHKKWVPYLTYIENIMKSGNEIAINVKMADILHNGSEERLRGLPEERQKRLKEKYKSAFKLMMSYETGSR
jgi:hypothetical protein